MATAKDSLSMSYHSQDDRVLTRLGNNLVFSNTSEVLSWLCRLRKSEKECQECELESD